MKCLGVLLLAVIAMAHANPQMGFLTDIPKTFLGYFSQGGDMADTAFEQSNDFKQDATNMAGESNEFKQEATNMAGQSKEFKQEATNMAEQGSNMENVGKNMADKASGMMKKVPKSPDHEKALKDLDSVLNTFESFKGKELDEVCNPKELIKKITDVKKCLTEEAIDKTKLAKELPELCDKFLSLSKHIAEKKEQIVTSISKDKIDGFEKKIKDLTTTLQKLSGVSPPKGGDSPDLPGGVSPDDIKSLEIATILKKLKDFDEVKKKLSKSIKIDELIEKITKIKEKILEGKLDECKSELKMVIKKLKFICQVLNSKDIKDNCPEAAKYSEQCKKTVTTLEDLHKGKKSNPNNTSNDEPKKPSDTPDNTNDDSNDKTSSSNDNSDDTSDASNSKKTSSDDGPDDGSGDAAKKSTSDDNSGDGSKKSPSDDDSGDGPKKSPPDDDSGDGPKKSSNADSDDVSNTKTKASKAGSDDDCDDEPNW